MPPAKARLAAAATLEEARSESSSVKDTKVGKLAGNSLLPVNKKATAASSAVASGTALNKNTANEATNAAAPAGVSSLHRSLQYAMADTLRTRSTGLRKTHN